MLPPSRALPLDSPLVASGLDRADRIVASLRTTLARICTYFAMFVTARMFGTFLTTGAARNSARLEDRYQHLFVRSGPP